MPHGADQRSARLASEIQTGYIRVAGLLCMHPLAITTKIRECRRSERDTTDAAIRFHSRKDFSISR
jgi:hypothetical protein